jgi:hypothetical protein
VTSFKNISTGGDLDLPALDRVVAAGEIIDVPLDLAEQLAEQPDVWQDLTEYPPGYESQTVPELRQLLADRGLPTTGKKDELVDRLTEADHATAQQGETE